MSLKNIYNFKSFQKHLSEPFCDLSIIDLSFLRKVQQVTDKSKIQLVNIMRDFLVASLTQWT